MTPNACNFHYHSATADVACARIRQMKFQRLFVSSALLVAPAVHAATGLHVRPADPAAQGDAEIFCPFEFQLQTSLETLEEQGIARPDFERIGPADASVWADGVAEKFSIKSR